MTLYRPFFGRYLLLFFFISARRVVFFCDKSSYISDHPLVVILFFYQPVCWKHIITSYNIKKPILHNSLDINRTSNKNAAPANPGIQRYHRHLKALYSSPKIYGVPINLEILGTLRWEYWGAILDIGLSWADDNSHKFSFHLSNFLIKKLSEKDKGENQCLELRVSTVLPTDATMCIPFGIFWKKMAIT